MNIGIIGLGLIGGSLGRAIVKRTKHRVFAFDTDAEVMSKGLLLDAYHEALTEENVKKLDVLIVSLYPKATVACMRKYAPLMKTGGTIIDCAGIKREIVNEMIDLHQQYPDIHFMGTHPMAGKEFSGINHSTATLFDNASVLFVPVGTPVGVRADLKKLFLDIGAERIIFTNAEEHDKMIAYTSQLAHVVSSAYVDNPSVYNYYGFTAGSFRDMTRVAKLNPEMWSEIMLENSDYLTQDLDIFIDNLQTFRAALTAKDKDGLKAMLAKGNEIKVQIESNRLKKLEERAGQED